MAPVTRNQGHKEESMPEEEKRTEKHSQARNSLPPQMVSVFDELVSEYRFLATKHHRSPFVSYAVLADLIRAGWRPSAQTVPESKTNI